MVETKYIKIGIAATAAVALTIGLSVGLTSEKAGRNVSSSQATEVMWGIDYCSTSGKSGKSGGSGSGKSGKSGGNGDMSMPGSGKSGKSGGGSNKGMDMVRRALVVPGTEEYHEELAGSDLERRLGSKSSKSGCGSSKSGKSSRACTRGPTTPPTAAPVQTCAPTIVEICSTGKSGKSGGGKGDGSGKSGKSGGKGSDMSMDSSGKSGKSGGKGGDMSMGSSGKSGKSGGKGGDMSMGCGKSGKSGGGKGKSGGDDDDDGCGGDSTKSGGKSNKSGPAPSPSPSICTSAKSSKSTSTKSSKPPTPSSKGKADKGVPTPPPPTPTPPTPTPPPPTPTPPTPTPPPPTPTPPTPTPPPPTPTPPTPTPPPPTPTPPTPTPPPPTPTPPSPGPPCNCPGAETTWSRGCTGSGDYTCTAPPDQAADQCFSDIDGVPNRWGWTTGPLDTGMYSLPLYRAAGNCNVDNGDLVGSLVVNYDAIARTADVGYDLNPGVEMTETQLYVGCDPIYTDSDGNLIVAPGSLPFKKDPSPGDCSSVTYDTITDLDCGDDGIYIYAHANTCLPDDIGTPQPTMQGTTTVAAEKESGPDSQFGAPRPAPVDETTGEGGLF